MNLDTETSNVLRLNPSVEVIIDLFKSYVYDAAYLVNIISWDKLSTDQMIEIGREADNRLLWVHIATSERLSTVQILTVFHDIKETNCRIDIGKKITYSQFNLDEMFEIGQRCVDHDVWKIIANNTPWSQLSTDEMVDLEVKAHDFPVTLAVEKNIPWSGLSIDKMISIANKSYGLVLAVSRNIPWSQLSTDKMLKIGRKVKDSTMWIAIIRTGRIPSVEMMKIGRKVNQQLLWIAIVGTKKLSSTQLMEVGRKAQHWTVWQDIMEVGSLSGKDMLQVSRELSVHSVVWSESVWESMIKNIPWSDLSTEEILEIGYKANLPAIWKVINNNFPWAEVKLTAVELITIGRKANNNDVWLSIEKVLKNK